MQLVVTLPHSHKEIPELVGEVKIEGKQMVGWKTTPLTLSDVSSIQGDFQRIVPWADSF